MVLALTRPVAQAAGTASAVTPRLYLPVIASAEKASWLGPEGGIITCLVADPITPSTLYAGTWGGGVFKSTDGGGIWSASNAGLGNLMVNSLAVDPLNPLVLYAGSYKDKVYKSTDGGANWFASGGGMQEQAVVYALAVDPLLAGVVYAGTRGVSNNGAAPWAGVLYRSTNAGASWQAVLSNIGGADQQDWIYSLAINPKTPTIVYAASHEHGAFRSDDRGATWYAVNNGIGDGSGRVIAIDPQQNNGNTVYMGVWHRSGVFKTINGGQSWMLEENGITDAKIYSMAIDPVSTNYLYLATVNQGVMKSANSGASWSAAGSGLPSTYALLVDRLNNARVFSGTAGDGLFLSGDGGRNWGRSQAGLYASQVTALVQHPTTSTTLFTSTLGSGVMKSSNGGETWAEFNLGLGERTINQVVMHPTNPNVLYALTYSNGLWRGDRSTTLGWQKIGSNLPTVYVSQPLYDDSHPLASFEAAVLVGDREPLLLATVNAPLLALAIAPSNPRMMYLGSSGAGLFRSLDEGATWQAAGFSGQTVGVVNVDTANANLVYAASDAAGGLKVSSNGGLNWSDGGLGGVSVYALARSAGMLYAGTSDGIYRKGSGGWARIGLAGTAVTAIGIHPSKAEIIITGSANGAWLTRNGGSTWEAGPSALAHHLLQSIQFNWQNPAEVFFSTRGHGVFRTLITW